MNQDSKILVTGGTGFVGSYILRELIQQGYTNIHALRRIESDRRLIAIFEDKITWYHVDLDHVDEVYRVMEDSKAVIHSAGLVSFAPDDRDELYQVNVHGTATVVNACLEHQVDRLIHVSSSSALAKVKTGQPITEQTKWTDDRQVSQYGRSKHLAEIEVWRGIAEGLDAVILNPTIILGAGIWDTTSCKLFRQIHDGLKYYTPGSTGFVDVRDVARIAVDMLHSEDVNQSFILNESNYHFKEIFTWIAQGLKVAPPSRLAPRWLARIMVTFEILKSKLTGNRPIITPDSIRNAYENFSYDNAKIRSRGYEFISIEETIRDTTAIFRVAYESDLPPKLLPPKTYQKTKSSI